MAYILMALMTLMMMRNTLAILMLFHHFSNILLFRLMVMDLADLVTRIGIPCARSIFDEYILLLDLCLIARNRNLRLNEKKLYTLFIYTLSDR